MATTPKTKARASPGTPEINDKPITKNEAAKETVAEHLPPLGLIFTVIACSGFLFVYSFRDVFATGKVFGGSMDMAMQVRLVDSEDIMPFRFFSNAVLILPFLELYQINRVF